MRNKLNLLIISFLFVIIPLQATALNETAFLEAATDCGQKIKFSPWGIGIWTREMVNEVVPKDSDCYVILIELVRRFEITKKALDKTVRELEEKSKLQIRDIANELRKP